jgi:hypothetical protein
MIPTNHDYYRRRAEEHQRLATDADAPDQRAMHTQLVEAYRGLARQSRLRQVIRLKVARNDNGGNADIKGPAGDPF